MEPEEKKSKYCPSEENQESEESEEKSKENEEENDDENKDEQMDLDLAKIMSIEYVKKLFNHFKIRNEKEDNEIINL